MSLCNHRSVATYIFNLEVSIIYVLLFATFTLAWSGPQFVTHARFGTSDNRQKTRRHRIPLPDPVTAACATACRQPRHIPSTDRVCDFSGWSVWINITASVKRQGYLPLTCVSRVRRVIGPIDEVGPRGELFYYFKCTRALFTCESDCLDVKGYKKWL